MTNDLWQTLKIWLELRYWDVVMWLDDRLRDYPVWRTTVFRSLYNPHPLPPDRLIMIFLAGLTGTFTGVILGLLIF